MLCLNMGHLTPAQPETPSSNTPSSLPAADWPRLTFGRGRPSYAEEPSRLARICRDCTARARRLLGKLIQQRLRLLGHLGLAELQETVAGTGQDFDAFVTLAHGA